MLIDTHYLKVLICVLAHLQMIAKYSLILKNTIKCNIDYKPRVPVMDTQTMLRVEAR